MDSRQLTRVLTNDEYVKPHFAGVFAHDQLHHRISRSFNNGHRRKAAIIYNLDPHYLPGSHWVALFLNFTTESAEYFDSMGLSPDPACRQLLQNNS